MERFAKRTEILTDLLHINKDCSLTCRHIMPEIMQDPHVHDAIETLLSLCRDCMAELHMSVDPTYGDPADAVDYKGGIYRTWHYSGNSKFSRQTPEIFNCCEKKVQALKNAYELALHEQYDLPSEITLLLTKQLQRVSTVSQYITYCKNQNTAYLIIA